MIIQHLPILQVVIFLVAAPVCIFLRNSKAIWFFTTLICFISFFIACLLLNQVYLYGNISYAIGGWVAPWGIEYVIDKLAVYLLLIVTGLAALVILGGRKSLESEIATDRLYLFYIAYLLNITGLTGLVVTGDVFNVFVFIEISSLSSYAMISVSNDKRSLYAAFKYLILGTIGASFILISVGLLYAVTGTLNMADLNQNIINVENYRALTTVVVFFTIGIALKSAIFPLHVWLPDAYSYSPSIVSSFLSGTSTKVFIYILIRFIFSVFGYEFSMQQININYLLMFLSCGALVYGSVLAIKQDSIKRILAYSSIAQIGYMVLGVSMATEMGLSAGLLHIFNHAIIKVSLFLSVAIIIYNFKTDSIEKLKGTAKLMPLTITLFVISGLSLIGVPLTSGFISKWFLIKAAFMGGYWPLIIVILFSSVLSIIYIGKICEKVFFYGSSPKVLPVKPAKTPYLLYLSLIILVCANLYFGVQTSISVGMADEIARELFGQ